MNIGLVMYKSDLLLFTCDSNATTCKRDTRMRQQRTGDGPGQRQEESWLRNIGWYWYIGDFYIYKKYYHIRNTEMVNQHEICFKHVLLIGGLEHDLYLSTYWECHHPNWLIFFRGVENTNQLVISTSKKYISGEPT